MQEGKKKVGEALRILVNDKRVSVECTRSLYDRVIVSTLHILEFGQFSWVRVGKISGQQRWNRNGISPCQLKRE